jgi:hypothetical protein
MLVHMTDQWHTSLDVATSLKAALDIWNGVRPSIVSAHPGRCCRIARAWFLAADASYAATDYALAPIWLRGFRPWGPAPWPSHWCELARFETWDCGHYAAVAAVLLERRGYTVARVQFVQRAKQSDCSQWSSIWHESGLMPDWIGDGLVYHEACAIVGSDHVVSVWDPTENLWLNPTRDCAQAQNIAVKFVGPLDAIGWGGAQVRVGEWTPL